MYYYWGWVCGCACLGTGGRGWGGAGHALFANLVASSGVHGVYTKGVAACIYAAPLELVAFMDWRFLSLSLGTGGAQHLSRGLRVFLPFREVAAALYISPYVAVEGGV